MKKKKLFVLLSLLVTKPLALGVRIGCGSGTQLDFTQKRGRRRGEREEEGKGEGCLGADPRPREEPHGQENSCPSYPESLNFFIGLCGSYSPAYCTGGGERRERGEGEASDFMKSILITLCNPQHAVITRLLCSSTKKKQPHQESNIKLESGNMKIHETHNEGSNDNVN